MTAGTCSAEGCDRPVHARGLCSMHYWPVEAMNQFLIVRDGALWLVVIVPPEGPGAVLGRWTDRERAERECIGWLELETSPPRVSDTRGGGTGHRNGPQGA